jgi:DNA-binding protein YbaB
MTFIVFDPLPSAASLQPALTTIEQQLGALDALLRGKLYNAASADQKLKCTVNGALEVTSMTINPTATNPATPQAVGTALVPVVNAAITAAQAQTPTDVKSSVTNMNLAGICTPTGSFPNYAGFPEAAAVFAAEKPTLDSRIAARTFQGRSGDVTATVNGQFQVVSLAVTRIPDVVPVLEADVLRALNAAITAAMGLTDATVALQVDALATNSPTFADVCLYARGNLQISDNVVVKTAANAGAPIGNAGNGTTSLGLTTRVGNVWSWAKVTAQSSARVEGFVKTAQTFTPTGSPTVTGGVSQGVFFVLPELSLVPTFPAQNQGSVTVANGQTKTLAPGNYDSVTVNSGGTLKLSTGTYFINICDLQAGGTTLVTSTAGRVIVHVHGLLKITHQIKSSTSSPPNLFMGSYGLEVVRVAAPFTGTLIAPGAEINLSPANAHSGAFFGKDITTAANTSITFVPYTGNPLLGTF